MAKYTIELRDVVKHTNIFDFSYPFYDENKRAEFEEKFIKHFYFREIGTSSIDRFKYFLQDKFNTVFPYYNKLFEATEIEYSVLKNYDLTETFTRTVDGENKSSGISSTVGRTFDEQHAKHRNKRDTTINETIDSTGNVVEVENADTESNVNRNEQTETETNKNNNTSGSNSKTTDSNTSGETEEIKRFLDTPQGKLDLSDSKYLTSLNHDNSTSSSNTHTTENGTNEENTTENNDSTSTTDSDENTKSESVRNLNRDTVDHSERVANETSKECGKVDTIAEQKTMSDGNTRVKSEEKQVEDYIKHTIGDVGVTPASEMIMYHIKLQKVLMNIEKMFFEECEDLFMLVY